MNIFVVIREILYNFIVTIIYVFLITNRFPQVIEQLQRSGKQKNGLLRTSKKERKDW